MTTALDAITPSSHAHLQSIPGIGKTTAAVLVAKVVSIDRFATPAQMVSYFGIFPEESSSGVDKAGRPLPVGKVQMSKKGNDLVRHYLWHAARTGVLYNPALRSLYARQRSERQTRRRGVGALHAQAVASGVRHLEEWKTIRPQPLSSRRATRGYGPHGGLASRWAAVTVAIAKRMLRRHRGQSARQSSFQEAVLSPFRRRRRIGPSPN